MSFRRATTLAVAGLAIIALAMGPATAGHKARGRYLTGTPAGGPFLPDSGPSYGVGGPNIGGVWFKVPAWATSVSATVTDAYSETVAADLVFVIDEYGPLAKSGRFCGSTAGVPLPAGTKAMYVRVLTLGSLGCSPPGVPTTGIASVTFG